MPVLQLLRADHEQAVLAFERANRAYFARFVSDRGKEFFDRFAEQHRARLAEQEAGEAAYYVLLDPDSQVIDSQVIDSQVIDSQVIDSQVIDSQVIGRFNLWLEGDGVARLGYRVAELVAGRGVATSTVRELCRVAADRHGLHTVRAATSLANVASQRVLLGAGFTAVGPADPAEVGGKEGTRFQRRLSR